MNQTMDLEQYYIGTDLKFLITIECEGFTIGGTGCDFDVVLKCGNKRYKCKEQDVVFDEDDNCYLLVNSSMFISGTLLAIFYVHVPDTDFEDGIRTEVGVIELCKLKST